uniref:Hsp20/alpha crystallin family protein n=1 Tax=Schlesneria paludicola TaxID=360056 RepID=A0A7C4LM77_9PLAN
MSAASTSNPFDRLRSEFDRWLETARITGERALDAVGLAPENRPLPPHADIVETDTDVHVLIDLPGVPAEGVDLAISGQTLTLKARRTPPPLLGEGTKWHLRERLTQAYERSFHLPLPIEADSIRAIMRDGLLQVVVRKSPQVQPRTIPIHRGGEPTA